MANIKSAKKRIRVTANKTRQNNYWKKSIKTAIYNIKKALAEKQKKVELEKLNNKLKSTLDKATRKKVVSKQKASRIKSKYQKSI